MYLNKDSADPGMILLEILKDSMKSNDRIGRYFGLKRKIKRFEVTDK